MARSTNLRDVRDRLTHKQFLFCENYLSNGFIGEKAAISAGHSKRSASAIASENLRKPAIMAYLKERQRETFEKLGMTQEYKARCIKETIEASMSGRTTKDGVFDKDGVLKSIQTMNEMDGSNDIVTESKVIVEGGDKLTELIEKYEKDI